MTECIECKDCKEHTELVKLKCDHSFCWICIEKYLKNNLQVKIKCPLSACPVIIRDALIRRVLCDADIAKYEKLCLDDIKKKHNCLLPGCTGSIVYTDPDIQYGCEICTLYNCITCKAPHNFVTCVKFKQMNEKQQNVVCETEKRRASEILNHRNQINNRELLQSFENQDLIPNSHVFECRLCTLTICKGAGVMLRGCSHNFCKECLQQHIKGISETPVKCPNRFCENIISDGEIESLLSKEDFNNYLIIYNQCLKKGTRNYLQCQTPNCDAFFEYSTMPDNFTCKTCNKKNCVRCKTIHKTKETCEEYQKKMSSDCTLKSIEQKIKDRMLMRCPGCQSLLEKTRGCNWVQCRKCSLECCWILQIPRWGPKGRGDTSGGCKCGVNGKKCDPRCTSSCTPHSSLSSLSRRQFLSN